MRFCHQLLGFVLISSATATFALEQYQVEYQAINQFVSLPAKIEAVNQSTISAQTRGAVEFIAFDVNDKVQQGDVVLRINATQQTADVAKAQANLAAARAEQQEAQRQLQRSQRLLQQKTISQGDFDSADARAKQAQAMLSAAEAQLKQAQEQLAYTEVKAPYSGVLITRHIELGELVNPGQPLMTGMALSPLRAVVDLPLAIAKQYQGGIEQLSVLIDEQSYAPSSATLFPVADAAHHSVRLRADLAEEVNALAGQWATLRIALEPREVLLIPQTAVLQRSELSAVYLIKNKQPVLRQVRLGQTNNGAVEVLSGLKAGDIVVVDALAQLAELAQEK